MGSSDPALSADSIKDILTLRYNSEIEPRLPRLASGDFTATRAEVSAEFIKKTLRQTLRESVKDEKASIALSRGIDSALCLALLRETFPAMRISAISVRFEDSIDETPHAKRIAEHFDAEHETIEVKNFLYELPKSVSVVRQPFWDLHWYHIVKRAKADGNCLISGDGGDELFGGYTFRYQKFLSLIGEESSPIQRAKTYLQCHERDWVPDQEDMFGKRVGFSWENLYQKIAKYFENRLPPIQQILLADYNGKLLYNFNPINSAFCRHFGVDSVAPILSKEMISYSVQLEPGLKYDENANVGKLPLRNILDNYIDGKHLMQGKQGFSVNTQSLWKSYGYRICEDYLADARTARDGWINPVWIEKHLKPEQDVRYINKFLGLLAFEVWYRLFFTNELEPDAVLE